MIDSNELPRLMKISVLPGGFLAFVLSALLAAWPASGQDEAIDATEHTCAELRRRVDETGALKISYPRTQNYASNPNVTLVYRPRHSRCPFPLSERLTRWRFDAADERCVLYTRIPFGGDDGCRRPFFLHHDRFLPFLCDH